MTSAQTTSTAATPLVLIHPDFAGAKPQLLHQMLQHSAVEVFVDHQQPGVKLGMPIIDSFHKYVQLFLGLKLLVPIPDLVVNEEGIAASLRFGRQAMPTFVPWRAVFAMEGWTGREPTVCYWPADFPKTVGVPKECGVPAQTSWSLLPEWVKWALRDDARGPLNDQALITYDAVKWLSSSAAYLLLQVDEAMQKGGTGQYWGRYETNAAAPAAQRGAEKRQIESLYHHGLLSSSSGSVTLKHELSPEARIALRLKAKGEERRRDQAAHDAALRAVTGEERATYAELLGLRKQAGPDEIIEAIWRLKRLAGGSR